MKRVLHFIINIFDTKFDIYGFLSSDDYVEKPQTRDARKSERKARQKPANWISFRWVNDRFRECRGTIPDSN